MANTNTTDQGAQTYLCPDRYRIRLGKNFKRDLRSHLKNGSAGTAYKNVLRRIRELFYEADGNEHKELGVYNTMTFVINVMVDKVVWHLSVHETNDLLNTLFRLVAETDYRVCDELREKLNCCQNGVDQELARLKRLKSLSSRKGFKRSSSRRTSTSSSKSSSLDREPKTMADQLRSLMNRGELKLHDDTNKEVKDVSFVAFPKGGVYYEASDPKVSNLNGNGRYFSSQEEAESAGLRPSARLVKEMSVVNV